MYGLLLQLVVAPFAPFGNGLKIGSSGAAVRQERQFFVDHGIFPAQFVEEGEPGGVFAVTRQFQHGGTKVRGGDAVAKIGIDGVNSNLATAIRTFVVLIMSWGMVFLTNSQNGISDISKRSWIFLILSGLATGASWLCYYKALQMGDASKVVPIDKLSVVITLVLAFVFLHEEFTAKSIVGCVLIGAGTLMMVL